MASFVENINKVAKVITSGVLDPNAEGYSNAVIASNMAEVCTNIYDQFDDRYLGSKSIAPMVDNDGNSLVYGALFFDNVNNFMKVWSNAGWINVGSSETAYTVATVENLVSVPSDYTTAIVKDLDRGGTFIWSATGTANGGTVFAGASGYWNRQYSGAVNVKWFGAVGDETTDDTVAIQSAVDYAKYGSGALGNTIYAPSGTYRITSSIDFMRVAPSEKRVSMFGDGEGSTRFACTSTTKAFKIGASDTVYNPSHQKFSNFSMLGHSVAGQTAMYLEGTAFLTFENIRIEGFDDGIYGINIDQTKFYNMSIRYNKRGATFQNDKLVPANQTKPNIIEWYGFHFSSNTEYGAYIKHGAEFSFIGGSFENNGTMPNGFGLHYHNSGYQGGIGASCYSIHFENNRGIADLIITNDDPIPAGHTVPISDCVHNVVGCSFSRNNSTVYPVNQILCSFGLPTVSGNQVLNLNGCAFKTYLSYVVSASRMCVKYNKLPMSPSNLYVTGCMFQNPLETPLFQDANTPFISVNKMDEQVITSGTYQKVLLDTVAAGAGFSRVLTENQVLIPKSAVYGISFNAFVSGSTLAGGILRIKKNGSIVASQSMGGSESGTLHTIETLAQGDLISVEIKQTSGADRTLLGSGTSSGNLIIVKLADLM